jgi:tripartite-type tricarboxylate transporter receptor subunit TctC
MKNASTMSRLLAAVALGLVAGTALAQSYPARPIRLIVSFPPGGPADFLGRFIGQKMGEGFGRPAVVENRPGANSIIAAELVAKAPPDGYTLLMAIDGVLVMNPSLYTKLPYDPVRDFAPVGLVATIPNLIVANNGFGPNSLQELIAYAKARPGQVNMATSALPVQLAAELLASMAGIKLTMVPYKGGNTSVTALIAGDVPLSIEGISTAMPHVKAGKIKALAVTTAQRMPQVPNVPTVAESGVPGFSFAVWQSVVGPAGMPREIVLKLNAELGRIMKLPEARERLEAVGIEPAYSTPEEMAERIRSDTEKWGAVIRKIGMKIE